MSNTIFLKLTSAIVVGGEVVKPPALIEVTESEAKALLHRGKAEVATDHDGQPSARSMSAENALNPEIADFNAAMTDADADAPQADADADDADEPSPARPNNRRRSR